MNWLLVTVSLMAVVLTTGCMGLEAPRADDSPVIDPDEADGLFVFTNDHPTTDIRVTVYVADGPVENYSYTLVNGSTITRVDPVLGHTTHAQPATDLFWSHTYVVDAQSSLVIAFDDPPPSARLVHYHEPASTAEDDVPNRWGGGESSDMCYVSIEKPEHSHGGGGCAGFRNVVYENRTTYVGVSFGPSGEPATIELNAGE